MREVGRKEGLYEGMEGEDVRAHLSLRPIHKLRPGDNTID